MYNIRKEQSSMLWCNFMKQFSNMEFWIDDFKEKLLQSFGDRIICFGLQGSYGRGEQTSTSDIDVVVILDRVSFSDLQTYRKVLDTNGCREMLCGFVAGKEELLAWEKYDLLQLYPHDKFLAWMMCMGCCLDIDENRCAEVRGCTAFAFTCAGKTYYARTNDLPPFLKKISKSILYQPEDGNTFLLNTSSFTNGEEGMNEHGLVAAMTFAVPKLAEIKPGLNSVFLVRYLLEKCRTVDEGISAIQRLPVSSNCNILIADKTGRMVVVECNPFEKHVRIPQVNEYGNKFIITVNELLSSEMAIHKASQGDTFFSKERYATAENALLKLKDNPIDNAKSILSGKCGFMCQYAKELNFDTVWATIFNLSDLKVYRAEGNPKKKSFVSDDRLMSRH